MAPQKIGSYGGIIIVTTHVPLIRPAMKGLNDGEKDGIAGVGLLNFPMKESLKKVGGGNHHHKYVYTLESYK